MVRAALEWLENEIWLSPIRVWEAVMLAERGRLLLKKPAAEWVDDMMMALPRREVPLTHEIAIASCQSRSRVSESPISTSLQQ